MRSHPFAVTIVIIGLIVAGAVLAIRMGTSFIAQKIQNNNAPSTTTSPVIRPISVVDHILGNPSAPIVFLEYGDFECIFCKEYHPEIITAIENLGITGEVALAYRHFPNSEKHPRARSAAIASECVANLLGNQRFFDYIAKLYENAPASLSDDALLAAAVALGAEESEFRKCIASNAPASRVDADYKEGLLLADNDPNFGTPYTIVISSDGQQVPFAGARPASYLTTLAKILIGSASTTPEKQI